MSSTIHLNNQNGKVLHLYNNYKAILIFNYDGKEQRALLLYDKLKCNGLDVPAEGKLSEYLQEGELITFDCHTYSHIGPDRCDWFVTIAWVRNDDSSNLANIEFLESAFEGKCNVQGTVVKVVGKQGVLRFQDCESSEKVLFFASKLFLYGNRVKELLTEYPELEEGSVLMFDAIPCDKEENDHDCSWFATVVWNGPRKPFIDYESVGTSLTKFQTDDILSQIKMISLNPRSTFIRGVGQILHILDEEYGLALGSILPNRWDSILFHRRMCFLFKMCLSGQDLKKIFKEGDKISFIVVPAPKKFVVQWIASHISVYRGPSVPNSLTLH